VIIKTKTLGDIVHKVLQNISVDATEAYKLYIHLPLSELMALGFEVRKRIKPGNIVSWIIDRNVNISNVCVSGCGFCSFYCKSNSDTKAFETGLEDYRIKINELFKAGGRQLLLQGGLNPNHGLNYYETLFRELKGMFPELKLHALGPPEVYFLARKENISIAKTLKRLTAAGLDSLPGAGAEILCDRVRKIVSPHKCNAKQWLNVMHQAHVLNIPTTATMMFGHIETPRERINHIFKILACQNAKPVGCLGFTAFIPWSFQSANTELIKKYPHIEKISADTYLRTIAISRIILKNVNNIQASWLTTGKDTAQLALFAGANDLGSIMLEENVVASSGVTNKLSAVQMQKLIKEAGFEPRLRNQTYQLL